MRVSTLIRVGLVLVVISGLVACGTDNDKEDIEIFRVGVLSGADIFNTTIDGFKAGLAEDGYIEGETITYDIQYAGGDPATMKEVSEKFVADKVDLIFVTTNNATLAAKAATEGTDIPVLFTFVIGPVDTGIVESLAQPGGHITGVQNPLNVSIGKRVEFWVEIAPNAKTLWAPYDPEYPTNVVVLPALEAVVSQLEIDLLLTPVQDPSGVIAAIETFEQSDSVPVDAVIILPDLTIQAAESWNGILAFSQEHNVPILANTLSQVEQGAILSYLTDNEASGVQASNMAWQIFNGIDAGDLPVETAELLLMVNLPAADAAGITMSTSFLSRAHTIFR